MAFALCTSGWLAGAGCEGTETRTVRIVATGIIEPVSLELQVAGASEIVDVTRDGAFSFDTEFRDGDMYAVDLVSAAGGCEVANTAGTVQGSDPEVVLVCRLLDNIELAGPGVPEIEFSATRSTYSADVSLLQDGVSVIASATRADIDIEIAGQPTASNEPSGAVPLALGETVIPVIARHAPSGAQVNYAIAVDRAEAIAQTVYAKASNTGEGERFGISLALSANGDTLAVGAYGEASQAKGVNGNQDDDSAPWSGAVYVFKRAGGAWEQQAYIKASNAEARDWFGVSVALSATGDTLAVGADREDSDARGVNGDEDDNHKSWSGAVYVFQRAGETWAQQAYIKASNTGTGDFFGSSVALSASGDTLAVAAVAEDSGATGIDSDQFDKGAQDSGAVYVFERAGETWEQQVYLKASNTGARDFFGVSLALSASGDTLVVGAAGEDSSATGVGGDPANNSARDSGAMYVFERAGETWSQEAYIKASNARKGGRFGSCVALSRSGDFMAVGAPYEDSSAVGVNSGQADSSARDSGAVYLFQRAGGSWSQDAYIKASNTGARDWFGRSVALSGSGGLLVVGASYEDSGATGMNGDQTDNSVSGSGAVYVFRRTGAAWQQNAYVKASTAGAYDQFGRSVALSRSGNAMAVGAPYEDSRATGMNGDQADNGFLDSGAVYIFH